MAPLTGYVPPAPGCRGGGRAKRAGQPSAQLLDAPLTQTAALWLLDSCFHVGLAKYDIRAMPNVLLCGFGFFKLYFQVAKARVGKINKSVQEFDRFHSLHSSLTPQTAFLQGPQQYVCVRVGGFR